MRLGAFAAVLFLVLGILLWRLGQGPIALDRLAPYIEAAFNRPDAPVRITVAGVRFGLDPLTHALDLQVEDVHVRRRDGAPLASFPLVATSFSLRALLRGRLAPTRFVVERPVVHLVRGTDGAIKLRLGGTKADAPELAPRTLNQTLGQLVSPLHPGTSSGASFGLLSRVLVRDATVTLDDLQNGRRWRARHVDAAIERDAVGLAGTLSLALPLDARTPLLQASYRYVAATHRLALELAVDGFEPAALAPLDPALTPLSAAHLPLSGTIEARFDLAAFALGKMRVDLGFGRGTLAYPGLAGGALPLDAGELHAAYDPRQGELTLGKLTLDLGGGAAVRVAGVLDGLTPAVISGAAPPPPSLPGRLAATVSKLSAQRLKALWPPDLGSDARRWISANIREGVLDAADVAFTFNLDTAARSAVILSGQGNLRYHDLTIGYIDGLPPVRKVSGTGVLHDDELDFSPTSGALSAVAVAAGGAVKITDIYQHDQWLTIDLPVAGPVRDVLETLDQKPLRYARAIGIDPSAVTGQMAANLHFRLPLKKHLKFSEVDYSAKAKLSGVTIAKIALGRGLSDGRFALDLARDGAELKGDARLDAVPTTIDARLFFTPDAGARARYRIALTLDDAERRRLGLDFLANRLQGPVGVDLTYSILRETRAQAVVRLDLRQAALRIAAANWEKPANAPGTATVVVDLDHDKPVALPQVTLAASGLDLRLALDLAPGGNGIERITIGRLVLPGDDVDGSVTRRQDGGWSIVLRGPRLDLSGALKRATAATPAAPPSSSPPSTPSPPLVIDAELGRLVLGTGHAGRELRAVSARLERADGYWQEAQIDARYVTGHRLSLRYGTDGTHRLSFQSDDLGATLALFDIADNVAGGQVSITGQVTETAGDRILRGHVAGANYRLLRAPAVAQILSLASFSGLVGMLSGSGIPFTTLSGNFAYANGELMLDHVLAYGGAIGVTASGLYNLGTGGIDLQGTLVPSYTLNTIISDLPGIGPLLMGGKGQGLFAASFHLTGSGGDPQVSVNPLSALAPGFLRRLFEPNFGVAPRLPRPPATTALPAAPPPAEPPPAEAVR